MTSLVIAALLLTGVAAAFSASAAVIENNDRFFRASQAARVSMNQILTEVRRCHLIEVPADDIQIRLITASGEDRTYKFFADATALRLITNDVTTDADYNLARNITDAEFSADTAMDANNTTYVESISVTLTVRIGQNEVRLSGSSAPRRNLSYAADD